MLRDMINRLCVDLYQGDAVTDFRAVYASGVRLVIHKASEGATIRDPKYAERRNAARSAGLLWGAYHFGRGGNVDAQVATFLSAASPDAETRLVLDWEVPAMTTEVARTFLAEVDRATGRPTILYSGEYFLREQLGNVRDTFFGARPLWIARYSNTPPTPQASWDRAFLWQYTDGESGPEPRAVQGITGFVDCSSFDGTSDELRAAWLGSSSVAPSEAPWSGMFDAVRVHGGEPRTAWVQSSLNSLQLDRKPLVVDGLNGPETEAAITDWQVHHDLTVDGVIGTETIASIQAALAAK